MADERSEQQNTQGAGQDPRPVGAPDQPREPRPAPRYGELAPEGWTWTPPGVADGASTGDGKAPDRATAPASPVSAAAPAAPAPAPSGQVPGVPHNLGVGADPAPRPASAARPETSERPDAYRASEPPQAGKPSPRGGLLADRIITIALLALGAYGALNLALSLQQLPQSMRLTASLLGMESLDVPEAVGIAGTVGAIVVLAIYAVNLIFSIQRMRARKLAFWVPLAAFGLALIVLFVCSTVAVVQLPELMQQMSDPDALSKILDQAGSLP